MCNIPLCSFTRLTPQFLISQTYDSTAPSFLGARMIAIAKALCCPYVLAMSAADSSKNSNYRPVPPRPVSSGPSLSAQAMPAPVVNAGPYLDGLNPEQREAVSVSYTHLTLPTILLV